MRPIIDGPATQPVEFGGSHFNRTNYETDALKHSDDVGAWPLPDFPMTSKIECNSFNVFVAELPVACSPENIGNVYQREINAVLQYCADVMQPAHL